jgi:manganese transport protein
MYRKILVALENRPADESIIPQIAQLARHLGSELLLLHVADGWAARNFHLLKLAESQEMKDDRIYLENMADKLRAQGLKVSSLLALGDPPEEILRSAREENCDLIAMTTHGHRFFGDLIFGSTINEVRHKAKAAVILFRSSK